MQDKEPKNEQGQPHGYYEISFKDGGSYKCSYINGKLFGFDDIVWSTGEISKNYYAR